MPLDNSITVCIKRVIAGLCFMLFANVFSGIAQEELTREAEPVGLPLKTANWQNGASSTYTFQESYTLKYIRKRIYYGDMLGKVRYYGQRASRYMPHTFDLMMRMPEYPVIRYIPQFSTRKLVDEHLKLFKSNQYKDFFVDAVSRRPINAAIEAVTFAHPDLVDHLWKDIPDVSNVGRNKLTRKAVDKSIATLLRDTFNTKPNLERLFVRKSPWTFNGIENVQLTQGYLKDWAKGGQNSIALSSDLRLNANFSKGKSRLENYIRHKVGILSAQDERGKINDDLIEVNSKYGLKSSDKWYYSFLYNFKTQFFYGYAKSDKEHVTPISGFFAPAYMSFALGMDYKPNKKFTLLLSPLTSRLTIVSDTAKFDQTRYGIKKDQTYKMFNGLSVVNNFSYRLSKEVNLTSKTDFFYQFITTEEEKQIQLDWELIVDMRINQFLSTRLLGNFRYFTNESDKLQIKEHFNIAFKYHF